MSDLLSGQAIADTFDPPLTDDEYNAVMEALDKARETLIHPTSGQVEAIARATVRFGRMTNEQVRAVLAAAAGATND